MSLNRFEQSGADLLSHLEFCLEQGMYDSPTWGYAFTLLAATESGGRFETAKNLALKSLIEQDSSSNFYSWEFVNYAWQRTCRLDSQLDATSIRYGETSTRMTNWVLLRQLNRIRYQQVGRLRAPWVVRFIRRFYTSKEGQILDELKTRSLQYHSFSLMILTEWYLETHDPKVLAWIIKGAEFSLSHVLEDGAALYIGRGQEQIFGYGALVFVLSFLSSWQKGQLNSAQQAKFELLASYLARFQRSNGSFPLVLNPDQPEPENMVFGESAFGWYGYNTLYDYQPFLAYCLLRGAKFLRGDYE